GVEWVTTNTGTPSGWLPPQPPAMSKLRRPVISAPACARASRKTRALAGEVRNANPSDPDQVSTSPPRYQPWSVSTRSSGPATYLTSDMLIPARTFPPPSPLARQNYSLQRIYVAEDTLSRGLRRPCSACRAQPPADRRPAQPVAALGR